MLALCLKNLNWRLMGCVWLWYGHKMCAICLRRPIFLLIHEEFNMKENTLGEESLILKFSFNLVYLFGRTKYFQRGKILMLIVLVMVENHKIFLNALCKGLYCRVKHTVIKCLSLFLKAYFTEKIILNIKKKIKR